eukprot:7722742-Pyramimonas_sp.AAC.1
MTDYRNKYMTLQITCRGQDPEEYIAAIEEAKRTGNPAPGDVSKEQLWARIKAQEEAVSKAYSDNYQLKLRMEQVI